MEQKRYLTLSEWAEVHNLSDRTVRNSCKAGKIPGAHKVSGGRKWLIPEDGILSNNTVLQVVHIEHWKELAGLAGDIAKELPLPLDAEYMESAALDRADKTIPLIAFRYSDIKWDSNAQGEVRLLTERKSPLLFRGLIAHLDFEFPGFKKHFEDWRRECTWYVGWNRPPRHWDSDSKDIFTMSASELKEYQASPECRKQAREYKAHVTRLENEKDYLVGIFNRVALRRKFKGTCEICSDM